MRGLYEKNRSPGGFCVSVDVIFAIAHGASDLLERSNRSQLLGIRWGDVAVERKKKTKAAWWISKGSPRIGRCNLIATFGGDVGREQASAIKYKRRVVRGPGLVSGIWFRFPFFHGLLVAEKDGCRSSPRLKAYEQWRNIGIVVCVCVSTHLVTELQ